MSEPIPHPPEKPIVGNALDIDSKHQVQDLMELARRYGPIFSIAIGPQRLVVVSGFELVDELCDESRFDKRVWAPLKEVRAFAGDGLFTAYTFEENWEKAHRILMPSFSQAAMRSYHPMMLDIANQMLERWQRLNPGDEIDVPDQMTRLTLDTIGLCGFSYRFNSFYRDRPHPFVRAMVRALSIAMTRSARLPVPKRLLFRENARFERAVARMTETVDGIVRERRESGSADAHGDLLGHMLAGEDPKTGERLDDVNIRYQIITFLIAGHETTSGLLSFAIYFLLEHPEVLRWARDEVDRVFGPLGGGAPTYEQVQELRYLRQVLNESLRLWPTAPMFALFPLEGRTTIGGRYRIDKHDGLAVLVPMLHRDRTVWGDDAESFDPEHFAPEREAALPANAFKPFGNGQRACIGRQFAMHEALLALGLILQRFELIDHRNARLEVQETLTLKPKELRIRIAPRAREAEGIAVTKASTRTTVATRAVAEPAPRLSASAHGTPLLVLYGSNMGTAEQIARRLAEQGRAAGFETEVAQLDEAVGRLPREGVVLIVSASYNGAPPDNAVRFCDWLEHGQLGPESLAGVRYAVFGCGHRDWAATYQRIPKRLDALLAEYGAERLWERGEGDQGGDFDGGFEGWSRALWPRLAEAFGFELDASAAVAALVPRIEIEVLREQYPNPFVQTLGAKPMVVVDNRELQSPEAGRSTRHIELALAPGQSYQTGDHLGVIPQNDEALVRRAAEQFGFDDQTRVRITLAGDGDTDLPLDAPISVYRLLRDYVELQQVPTRGQLAVLLEHVGCPPDRAVLEGLCGDGEESRERYRREVLEPHRSLLDVIQDLPSCEVPFSVFLSLLPPLKPRYYSISSSPQRLERILSLTVGVVRAPARSGRGTFYGVCSNYLARTPKGGTVYAFVRDAGTPFRPPRAPSVPMILVGPGTGIAPFRGFLQERAVLRERGVPIGESLLFFGCRRSQHDFLYREELEQLERDGVVRVVTAFSREQQEKIYVQDRIREEAAEVWRLLDAGAVVYVCGDATAMAPAVRAAFGDVWRARAGGDEAAAERWLEELAESGRYLVDVWAAG